jgi:urea-proton symporter
VRQQRSGKIAQQAEHPFGNVSLTAMLHAALCIFVFIVYGTSDQLGSPRAVYEHLTAVAIKHPVKGNLEGSYLTMLSQSGLIFGIINIIGNFGKCCAA